MKNIFKSRFSLIAICIVLGILIGSFALCGCRTNYGLLEGMATNDATEADNAKKKKMVTMLC
jgi:predicted Kef-type K+ transport protein